MHFWIHSVDEIIKDIKKNSSTMLKCVIFRLTGSEVVIEFQRWHIPVNIQCFPWKTNINGTVPTSCSDTHTNNMTINCVKLTENVL